MVGSCCATQRRQFQLNSFGSTSVVSTASSYVVVRYQSKNIMCDMNTILVFRYLLIYSTHFLPLLSSFPSYVQFVSNTNYILLFWLCLDDGVDDEVINRMRKHQILWFFCSCPGTLSIEEEEEEAAQNVVFCSESTQDEMEG